MHPQILENAQEWLAGSIDHNRAVVLIVRGGGSATISDRIEIDHTAQTVNGFSDDGFVMVETTEVIGAVMHEFKERAEDEAELTARIEGKRTIIAALVPYLAARAEHDVEASDLLRMVVEHDPEAAEILNPTEDSDIVGKVPPGDPDPNDPFRRKLEDA